MHKRKCHSGEGGGSANGREAPLWVGVDLASSEGQRGAFGSSCTWEPPRWGSIEKGNPVGRGRSRAIIS